jgi:hypothetical protein
MHRTHSKKSYTHGKRTCIGGSPPKSTTQLLWSPTKIATKRLSLSLCHSTHLPVHPDNKTLAPIYIRALNLQTSHLAHNRNSTQPLVALRHLHSSTHPPTKFSFYLYIPPLLYMCLFANTSLSPPPTTTINYSRPAPPSSQKKQTTPPPLGGDLRLDGAHLQCLRRLLGLNTSITHDSVVEGVLDLEKVIRANSIIQGVDRKNVRAEKPDSKSTAHDTPAHDPEALGGGGELVVEEEEGEADGAAVPPGADDARDTAACLVGEFVCGCGGRGMMS